MAKNRRVVWGVATAIFAAAVAAFTGAVAEAPFSKAQPVGYYRMMLGDIEVTALLDGLAPVPVGNLLRNTTPLGRLARLGASLVDRSSTRLMQR